METFHKGKELLFHFGVDEEDDDENKVKKGRETIHMRHR